MDKAPQSKWLQRSLIALMVVETLALVSSAMQFNLLSNPPYSMEAAEANDRRESIMGVTFLVAYFLTTVVFARWIIASHKTVRALGAEGMTITPGWAVGYYFIPFVNLVRPYTAMKELWCASMEPQNATSQFSPPVLPGWWALWIINGVLGQIIWRMSMNAESIDSLKTLTVVNIIGSICGVALSFVALKLVKGITGNIARHFEPPALPA
jgi:hypothetical protein